MNLRNLRLLWRAYTAPCVTLTSYRIDDDDLAPGESRLGGIPDLPPDFRWPEKEGRPLFFLAQIDLAACPKRHFRRFPLPGAGSLTFWYDLMGDAWGDEPQDRGAFQVHYHPEPSAQLERRPFPEFEPNKDDFDYVVADFEPFWTCALELTPGRGIINPPPPKPPSRATSDEPAVPDDFEVESARNRLLGCPNALGAQMDETCQLASNGFEDESPEDALEAATIRKLLRNAKDWVLLLQLGSDQGENSPEMMWVDEGSLYFWIRKQDLAERDFSKVWGILQCY